MNKVWHPYWAWETWQWGFYSEEQENRAKHECERLRLDFFRTEGLFEQSCVEVLKFWPVASEHFMTDVSINRIAWLGQVASFWQDGIGEFYSYAYNMLDKQERARNNDIAKKIIKRWEDDKESGNGIYKKVEKQRLQKGYTGSEPPGFRKKRVGTFVQGDLFGNTFQ